MTREGPGRSLPSCPILGDSSFPNDISNRSLKVTLTLPGVTVKRRELFPTIMGVEAIGSYIRAPPGMQRERNTSLGKELRFYANMQSGGGGEGRRRKEKEVKGLPRMHFAQGSMLKNAHFKTKMFPEFRIICD